MTATPVDDHAQIVEAFVAETDEILTRLEELLLRLEESPDDEELLHAIFRDAHTIQGNAACLQYDGLTAFAHVFEELLERLRNGEVHATPARVSRLLDALDALRDLASRSVTGDSVMTPVQEALMRQLIDGTTSPAGTSATSAAAPGTRRSSPVARGHVRQFAAQENSRERVLYAVRELDRLTFDLQEWA